MNFFKDEATLFVDPHKVKPGFLVIVLLLIIDLDYYKEHDEDDPIETQIKLGYLSSITVDTNGETLNFELENGEDIESAFLNPHQVIGWYPRPHPSNLQIKELLKNIL